VVAVGDPTDTNWQPRGKQVVNPKGIWYTPTTGIWQTVWTEEVPQNAIKSLTINPELDSGTVNVAVKLHEYSWGRRPTAIKVRVLDGNSEVASFSGIWTASDAPIQMRIVNAKPWSPDSPFLYTVQVETDGLEGDKVTSYFGMRKVSLGKDDQGVTRL